MNRKREPQVLSELLQRSGPTLALVTGRRRVGKTFLLSRAWPTETTFLFTATKTTLKQHRRQPLLDAAVWSGEDLHPDDYPTWRAVYDRLWRLWESHPLVIVLDEFQYFATSEQELAEVTSSINATLERQAVDRPFVLVLSGSAVSTMEGLATGGAPLFGRLATHVRLEPLQPYDTAEFVPEWSLRAKASCYGVLGGTPAYWSALDPKTDLRNNSAKQFLAREGRLRLQLDTLLAQEEGLGNAASYSAVVVPRLDTFLGHAFETFAAPTYERLRVHRSLPLVQVWGRWEGKDRAGHALVVDVVAPLVDKRVMTGAVKFSKKPINASVFFEHLDALRRAAEAGLRWAHSEKSGEPLLFLSAAGFTDRFMDAARAYDAPVLTWTLDDV